MYTVDVTVGVSETKRFVYKVFSALIYSVACMGIFTVPIIPELVYFSMFSAKNCSDRIFLVKLNP